MASGSFVGGLALSRSVVSLDIVNYSKGDLHRQVGLDRAREAVLDQAVQTGRETRYLTEDPYRRIDGDSSTVIMPVTTPAAWTIADLVLRELAMALGELNRSKDADHRLRVRLGVDHGEVMLAPPHIGGEPVIRAVRLRDAGPLRATLSTNPTLDFGLVVSDRVFTDVVRNRQRGLDPARFQEIKVAEKNFRERAWMFVPDASDDAGKQRRRKPAVEPPDGGPGATATVMNVFHEAVDARGAVFGIGRTRV